MDAAGAVDQGLQGKAGQHLADAAEEGPLIFALLVAEIHKVGGHAAAFQQAKAQKQALRLLGAAFAAEDGQIAGDAVLPQVFPVLRLIQTGLLQAGQQIHGRADLPGAEPQQRGAGADHAAAVQLRGRQNPGRALPGLLPGEGGAEGKAQGGPLSPLQIDRQFGGYLGPGQPAKTARSVGGKGRAPVAGQTQPHLAPAAPAHPAQVQTVGLRLRPDAQPPEGRVVYIIFISRQQRHKGKAQAHFPVAFRQKLQTAQLAAVPGGGGDGKLGLQPLQALPVDAPILGKLPSLRPGGEEPAAVQPKPGGFKIDEPPGQLGPAPGLGVQQHLVSPVGQDAATAVLLPALTLPAAGLRPVRLFRHRGQIPADDQAVLRQPLLEQRGVGGHGRVGQKAPLDAAPVYRVGRGQDAHARVVGHIAAHRLPAVAAAAARGEVQGLDKAVAAQGAEALQTAQIFDRALRLHAQGQKTAVWGDHHVVLLSPLQSQGGTAVGLVAVAEAVVQREKGALRNAPGLAGEDAALLGVKAEAAALIQETAPIQRQKQLRHQVFKHGARPAGQAPVAVLLELGPAEPAPVLSGHVAFGDGDVACQHGLACHQIVPAAGAPLPGGVVADIEQAPPRVVQRRKVHRLQNAAELMGDVLLAQLLHGGERHQKPGVQIAAVHGGDKGRVQRQQGAGVVPVIIVAETSGHAQQRVRDAADIFHGLGGRDQFHVHGRHGGGRRKADVGGGAAVGGAYGRLLLEVVRGQVVVLPGGKLPQIAPGLQGPAFQILPVRPAQVIFPVGGQRQRRGRRRGQKPHQPRRPADDHRRKQQAQRPDQHGKPHGPAVGVQAALTAVALGGSLPLQQLFMAFQHPPKGGDGGGETDPGLKGQQPQAHESLHDGAAHAGQQSGVAAQGHALVLSAPALREGEKEPAQQSQQRRPGRHSQTRGRQEEACQNGQKGGGRNEAAAQAVQQPPAVDVRQILPPAENPGGVLPVAPHPAVEPLIIGQGLCGEAVGKLRVAHEGPAEIGPLQRVVGQDAPFGEVGLAAPEQHPRVQDALAGKAPAFKGVHIQLAAEGTVGVAAPGPGENQGKIGGGGALKLGAHAWVDQGVARRHDVPLGVYLGLAQGMEHGADQLRGRARVHAGVAVQGDDIPDPRKGVPVAGDLQGGFLVAQQLCQLQKGAPLALAAGIALPIEAALPGEQVKAAAVSDVQLVYGPAGGAENLRIRLRLRLVRPGQIRQNAEAQVLPGAAVGKAEFLQPGGQPDAAARVRQQGGEHADGSALRGHALFRVHSGQPPGRDEVQQQKVQKALHQLRHRQQQKRRRAGAAHGKGQQQAQKQGEDNVGADVEPGAPARLPVKEIKAHMPHVLFRLLDQAAGQHMLLQTLCPGQLFQPCKIVLPGAQIHVGIVAGGIPGEDGLRHVGSGEELFRVQHGEEPQGAEKGLQLLGVLPGVGGILHGGTDLGDALNHGGPQSGGEQHKLAAPQHRHGLKAPEKQGAALLVGGAQPRVQQGTAQLKDQRQLAAEPQAPCPAEPGAGAAVLPLHHIPVVQQPLAGGRGGGLAAVAAGDGLVCALN